MHPRTRTFISGLLTVAAVSLALVMGQTDKCSESEFEGPHHEWGAACVARFVSHIGLTDKANTFVAKGIEGHTLRELNATVLESMNITRNQDQQKLLENIARLERHNPAGASGDSVLYLPLMLLGCGAFVYIMFLKGSYFEKTLQRNLRRITKKANASREGGVTDKDDWLQGTAASIGQGSRRRSRK